MKTGFFHWRTRKKRRILSKITIGKSACIPLFIGYSEGNTLLFPMKNAFLFKAFSRSFIVLLQSVYYIYKAYPKEKRRFESEFPSEKNLFANENLCFFLLFSGALFPAAVEVFAEFRRPSSQFT